MELKCQEGNGKQMTYISKKGTAKSEIVVLTGAGISADSGIATFRAADGLWENHPISRVATPEGYRSDPDLVHRFYNERRRHLASVKPNKAHLLLAALAERHSVTLITQNVDDLHQRAGSECLAMHGQLKSVRCEHCGRSYDWNQDLSSAEPCPDCNKTATLRPDIVWFGEMPQYLDEIQTALSSCEIFAAIGTSGTVYPAAGFVAGLPNHCQTFEINPTATEISPLFGVHIRENAAAGVAKFLDLIEGRR